MSDEKGEVEMKRVYFIQYYGTSGNGYVGYDNTPCNSLDYAMKFDTSREAVEWLKSDEAKEWESPLSITHEEIEE